MRTLGTKAGVWLKTYFGLLAFLLLCPLNLYATSISRVVSEQDFPQIYKNPEDIYGISYALHLYGVVIIKNVYSQNDVQQMKNKWEIFMDKFNKHVASDEASPKITEYGTHFFNGLKVDHYPTYSTPDFIAYKFGVGRYEISFYDPENSFVNESILTPKPLRDFLEHHFYLSDLSDVRYRFESFYGLLPSLPGNKDGLVHRDTTFLEPEDIDGDVTVKFAKGFYLTSILSLGDDPGSTEFYLGSHKMTGSEVKEKLANETMELIRPTMRECDVKLFDGRIGHLAVANPHGSAERKAVYAVHHASWYKDL